MYVFLLLETDKKFELQSGTHMEARSWEGVVVPIWLLEN